MNLIASFLSDLGDHAQDHPYVLSTPPAASHAVEFFFVGLVLMCVTAVVIAFVLRGTRGGR